VPSENVTPLRSVSLKDIASALPSIFSAMPGTMLPLESMSSSVS
jgi:hypothetical protein